MILFVCILVGRCYFSNSNNKNRTVKKSFICGDEGIGMSELIKRRTGEFENIVTNDAKDEQDDEKKRIFIRNY